ncbi:hypothetical protein TNCV_3587881 [Trichonephila clavipes]|nr:hypothetical protein TNCV_3587881 [Trichonephila clavipes]
MVESFCCAIDVVSEFQNVSFDAMRGTEALSAIDVLVNCTSAAYPSILWRLGRVPRDPDKLGLIRCSDYKFQSASAKEAGRSSAPGARNELKSALY